MQQKRRLLKKAPFLFLLILFGSAQAKCLAPEGGEPVQVKRVIDGDTLVLQDGRRVRLIGVNAPERARDRQPGEPLAERARDVVEMFVRQTDRLMLYPGADTQDRFGRTLAHLFNSAGESLEEKMLVQGVARHLVIGRNDRFQKCLEQAEMSARQKREGLWALSFYEVREFDQGDRNLTPGFHVLQGKVASVSLLAGKNWWLDLEGGVSVQIRVADQSRFDRDLLLSLRGRRIEARGWLIDRGRGDSAKSRWLLPVSHPAAVRELPKKCTGC